MKRYNESHKFHFEGAIDKPSCQAPGCDVNCNAAFACHQQQMLGLRSKISWSPIAMIVVAVIGLLYATIF